MSGMSPEQIRRMQEVVQHLSEYAEHLEKGWKVETTDGEVKLVMMSLDLPHATNVDAFREQIRAQTPGISTVNDTDMTDPGPGEDPRLDRLPDRGRRPAGRGRQSACGAPRGRDRVEEQPQERPRHQAGGLSADGRTAVSRGGPPQRHHRRPLGAQGGTRRPQVPVLGSLRVSEMSCRPGGGRSTRRGSSATGDGPAGSRRTPHRRPRLKLSRAVRPRPSCPPSGPLRPRP